MSDWKSTLEQRPPPFTRVLVLIGKINIVKIGYLDPDCHDWSLEDSGPIELEFGHHWREIPAWPKEEQK